MGRRRFIGEDPAGGNVYPDNVSVTWDPLPLDDAPAVTLDEYRRGIRPRTRRRPT